jgi:hypothetical protein
MKLADIQSFIDESATATVDDLKEHETKLESRESHSKK